MKQNIFKIIIIKLYTFNSLSDIVLQESESDLYDLNNEYVVLAFRSAIVSCDIERVLYRPQ